MVCESQHVDTKRNTEEIRTGLVDSCGEDDAKLERRKKNAQLYYDMYTKC